MASRGYTGDDCRGLRDNCRRLRMRLREAGVVLLGKGGREAGGVGAGGAVTPIEVGEGDRGGTVWPGVGFKVRA